MIKGLEDGFVDNTADGRSDGPVDTVGMSDTKDSGVPDGRDDCRT